MQLYAVYCSLIAVSLQSRCSTFFTQSHAASCSLIAVSLQSHCSIFFTQSRAVSLLTHIQSQDFQVQGEHQCVPYDWALKRLWRLSSPMRFSAMDAGQGGGGGEHVFGSRDTGLWCSAGACHCYGCRLEGDGGVEHVFDRKDTGLWCSPDVL